jgi:hypothetical protein
MGLTRQARLGRGKSYQQFESVSLRQIGLNAVFSVRSDGAIQPSIRSYSQFELCTADRPRLSRYSPKRPFLSEPLDSVHSVRFSKLDHSELLMGISAMRFGCFSRIGTAASRTAKRARQKARSGRSDPARIRISCIVGIVILSIVPITYTVGKFSWRRRLGSNANWQRRHLRRRWL